MIVLIDTKNLGSFCAYLWQKSQAGYDYEIEILHKEGFVVKKQQVLDNCETAQEILDDLLKGYDKEESEKIFSEFG